MSSLLYCITGNELLLRNEKLDEIRQHARKEGYDERISLPLDAKSDWGLIHEQTQSLSLFSNRKLLEITIASGKPGIKGSKALLALCEEIKSQRLQDVMVVIILPILDRASQNSQWAKSLLNLAQVCKLPDITREQLPHWIDARLKRQKQHLDNESLTWLADKVEGNLLAAHQEILKLGLSYPEGEITFQDIQNAVQDVARFDVFSLSTAMLSGNVKRTLRIINGLKNEGEPLPLVLGFMLRDIKDLYQLAQAREEGQAPESLFKTLRIFYQRQALMKQALNRMSYFQIMGILQHAYDIDQIFKGLKVAKRLEDPWQELIRLSLRITSPKLHL